MSFIVAQPPSSGGAGVGDVVGPGASTDNAVARFDGTTGKLLQNSGVILDDANSLTGINSLTVTTLVATTTVTTGDNIIRLNDDVVGAPTEDAGIEVERGASTDATLLWDETNDYWVAGVVGTTSPLLRISGLNSSSNISFISLGDTTSADLTNTAVSAGSYGSATQIPTFTVDGKGRLTAAANITVAPTGMVTGSGTATQVAFWDSPTSISGENELYWDSTNNRLGIGNNGPTARLDVIDTTVPQFKIRNDANNYLQISVASNGNTTLENSSINTGGASFSINSDAGGTNGNGGPMTFTSGAGNGSGQGGTLNFTTGAGGATGAGGSLTLQSGVGGSTSGDSGYVYLKSGTVTSGTKGPVYINDNGGNIILGGSTTAAELRFMEPSGSGTNYVAITCPALAANYTLTLPVDDGTSNQVLQTNGSGVLSWTTPASGTIGGSGTAGQIAYFSAGSTIASEASGFTWDATNNRLGIGTDTPATAFNIVGTSNNWRMSADANNYYTWAVNAAGSASFTSNSNTSGGGSYSVNTAQGAGINPGTISFTAGSRTTSVGDGAAISFLAGNGFSTGNGGALNLTAGNGGTLGGAVNIVAGDSGSSNATGAPINLTGGTGTGNGNGGALVFKGGAKGVTGAVGEVQMQGSGGNVVVGGSTTASEIRFMEPSASGTNYIGLKAPAAAANVTFALPNADGTAGQLMKTDGAGQLSFVTPTAASVVTLTSIRTDVLNTTSGEDDLMTYTLPANTLGVDGDYLEIHAWGTTDASANSRTFRMYFGGAAVVVGGTAVASSQGWNIRTTIQRNGSAAQDIIGNIFGYGAATTQSTQTKDLTATQVIKVTVDGGAASDTTQTGMTIRWYSA